MPADCINMYKTSIVPTNAVLMINKDVNTYNLTKSIRRKGPNRLDRYVDIDRQLDMTTSCTYNYFICQDNKVIMDEITSY